MIISTLVQARTLAAVLSFQLKRVLRGTPMLVGLVAWEDGAVYGYHSLTIP
jgi:hypothetical protein